MSTTFNVRFWEIQKKAKRRRPYGVRWVTDTQEHSEWFANKAQANSRRSELMRAARTGEPFEVRSGLPLSEVKRRDSLSFLEFAQSYMDMKWPAAAATSRAGIVDGLSSAGAAFVKDGPGRPSVRELRRVLSWYLLPPPARAAEVPEQDAEIVSWLVRNSRPLYELTETPVIRDVLDALTVKLDGSPVSEKLYRRKRSALYNLLSYAVERELIPDNPIVRVKHSVAKGVDQVDPGVVAKPRQVRELLTALTYVGERDPDRGRRLVAFFATIYYAGARPGEVMGLRDTDCTLPDDGRWGELVLGETRPAAGKRWTDSGEAHDQRGLKHRSPKERRHVPIPPALVAILRRHIDTYGTSEDGRLFRSPRGAAVQSSTYGRVWQEARLYALTDAQRRSMLAAVPYDLRHACVSLWLNSGLPATEVAARAGHSVDVLLKVYAKCIDGQRERMNSLIETALEDH
ncbi:phage integrase family protein [Prauserella shujinwangii]|uniref:Phage integrase family protein n=1 Tax=Prauserella shujinwangii TaxID=1453103 RepID=A0A2T0LTK6_9PSEU|nr:tyrosine-type recombinase/integrase [Prauserella shujinwangii]PRX47072.1 phage integrase family protein [Prauserella shujinwangii]